MHFVDPAFVFYHLWIHLLHRFRGLFRIWKAFLARALSHKNDQDCKISLTMGSRDGTLGGPSVSRCLGPSISWAGCKDWGEGGITQNYPNITTAQSTGAKRRRNYLEFAKRSAGSTVHFLPEQKAGMGWDSLVVLVSPPLKSLLKGPPPSFQGIPPIWSAGLFQKASSPTVTCVQTSSHRLERPTILQYSDFRKVVARVHRGRKLLESTVEGSC